MRNPLFATLLILFIFTGVQQSAAQDKPTEKELIDSLIIKKRAYNKLYGYGFRIQLFNGSEQQTKRLEKKFKIAFPDTATHLSYKDPEWKIQVGSYKTRLEADRAWNQFKTVFKSAIVVPM